VLAVRHAAAPLALYTLSLHDALPISGFEPFGEVSELVAGECIAHGVGDGGCRAEIHLGDERPDRVGKRRPFHAPARPQLLNRDVVEHRSPLTVSKKNLLPQVEQSAAVIGVTTDW